jgi:hypothetical protein
MRRTLRLVPSREGERQIRRRQTSAFAQLRARPWRHRGSISVRAPALGPEIRQKWGLTSRGEAVRLGLEHRGLRLRRGRLSPWFALAVGEEFQPVRPELACWREVAVERLAGDPELCA